jgi:hypothetical protein
MRKKEEGGRRKEETARGVDYNNRETTSKVTAKTAHQNTGDIRNERGFSFFGSTREWPLANHTLRIYFILF